MKMKHVLPLALMALMLTPAAFADATPSAASTMTLTNPEFINITVAETVKNSGATFNDTYTQITLSTPFDVTYTVINNKPARPIYLSAKATTSNGAVDALGGTTGTPILAFANGTVVSGSASGTLPTSAAVENAIGSSAAVASNANVIAFNLTPDIKFSEAATTAPTASLDGNKIVYTISNGKYTFNYKASQNQTPNTFSTHDENGTYSTTLTLSSTNP